jgi:inhibitor of cysteine peptidase
VFGESDTTIEVASGDDFVIELESNQTTGYQWTATSSDEAVVREQGNEYLAPSSDALGAPGKERFVFATGTTGGATLTLLYSRSFEDGADARQIVYTVTVT